MSEENNNQTEEIQEQPKPPNEQAAKESPRPKNRRRIFTRRNIGLSLAGLAIIAVLIAGLAAFLYRTGYVDGAIKGQFAAKMADFGIVFDADVFQVTLAPLELTLKNATFNDRLTGAKLFYIADARFGLTIEDLYAWQLSRDIKIDTTELNGVEAWVNFDENGDSNFKNINLAGPSVVNYSSVKFSMQNGVVHFGDVTRRISADVENARLSLEPENYEVPDDQKRYKFDFTSTDSQFTYEQSRVEDIDIHAEGIADGGGAEISVLKLTTPLGESNLAGTLTDWNSPKYDLKIDSTIDLTQTSSIFPLGTAIRGIGNFKGTVSGEGEKYKVDGEISSEALAAENIRLKALKITALVEGDDSMYKANGRAIAEMLTFEDFRVDFPQLIGNVRGTGTDFRWVGELQAIAAKTPLGTLGGLYITDAVAEYKYQQFGATLGNVRARSFITPEVDIESLQTRNVRVTSENGTTRVSAPNLRAGRLKTDSATLSNASADNIEVKNSRGTTDINASSVRAETLETEDARLRNVAASGVKVRDQSGGATDITARSLTADSLEANGADVGNLTANGIDMRVAGDETRVFSNNLQVARVETDAAVLGSLNIAGVRLLIRAGRIEATSDDFNAGDVRITDQAIADGGNLEQVRVAKPVFILEPSGAYRATADMSIGGGVLGSVKLGAARASLVAENEQIALNELAADVMDGKLSGNALIALTDRRRSQVAVDFSDLDLSKLLALSGGQVVPVEGQTTGQINLNFPGTNLRAASGTVKADFNANAGTEERGLVPVNGRLGLDATDGLFAIDYADLFTDKSRINAAGSFDLNGYDSNLSLKLDSTDAGEIDRIIRVLNVSPELEQQLDRYEAEFAGNLNFTGNLTGSLEDPTLTGRATLDSIILRKRNLGALSARILVSPEGLALNEALLKEPGGGTLAFDVTVPDSGTNNISVKAELKDFNTGNLLAALPADIFPAEQFQDFQAKTSGTLNLQGLPGDMQGRADISSSRGTINGEPFDGFEVSALFQGTLIDIEKFEGRFGDGILRADGTYRTDTTAFNFDLTGENIKLARVRPFIPNSRNLPQFDGVVNIKATATGRTEEASTFDFNFTGDGRNIVVAERSFGEVDFVGKTDNQLLNAVFTAKFQGQPQIVNAQLNFADENLPFRAETAFDQTELTPIIAIIRPESVDVSGRATGNVFLAGNLSRIGADGNREFTTDNLSGAANFSELALQIEETPLVATRPVSVTFNSRELVVNEASFSGGGSNLTIDGTKAFTDEGINNLRVSGKINLRVFNAVSKNSFFAGLADLSVALTGVNKTSRLTGKATLQNASVATFIGADRLTFERINGLIIFNSNQAQIENLTGFLGGGKVTASGGALVEGLRLQQFRLNVSGRNITAPLPPDFITTGDAEGEISGFREGGKMNTLIRGTFNARRSIYTKDIDVADIISGRDEGSLSAGGSGSGSAETFLGVPKLDIAINGRDALIIRNNLADLTASASLRVTGDIEFPQISGRITANSGTIFFRKDRYEVQRGVLEFPPNTSIEPYITLQAETEIRGYQIIVGLVGELTNTDSLNATVRSNPALPQPDVISLITTGNLANSDTGIPTLAGSGINTAAEILTDSFINNPASRATDKLFGLNRFEIDPIISGERLNPSARLTVGRQINRNLLITYSTNLSEDQNQVVAFEYRVSNRLSFVAQYEQRSLSNVTRNNDNFSFEIRLRKRF